MTVPPISVEEFRLYERMVTLRLPFRFGMITLTRAPQAFVRCRIRLADGQQGWGLAAEMMVPKWFDKNPKLTNEQNIDQLRGALKLYAEAISGNGTNTAFGHHASLYEDYQKTGTSNGLNPLVTGFGSAVIDRAVMDALCRLHDVSLARAVQTNLAGIDPVVLLDEFSDFDMDRFLAKQRPSGHVQARHTIGLIDPLTAADQSSSQRLDDGLPETLEEVIDTYGVTHFKIKVGGEVVEDVKRVTEIAAVLDSKLLSYKVTLDGNEQYQDIEGVTGLIEAITTAPVLSQFSTSILLLEQPIHRSRALNCDVSEFAMHLPIIIDESDGDLSSFSTARKLGYSGVSSKNCKGFYKSLINRARCDIYQKADGRPYFMSAEDLTCQAGIAVQQDLALVSLLGLQHGERNGHHYVHGMAGASEAEQNRFLDAHGDLYRRVNGQVCMHIQNGKISTRSLQCSGFGTNAEPDWHTMGEMQLTS
jgi:hypothetical protein